MHVHIKLESTFTLMSVIQGVFEMCVQILTRKKYLKNSVKK
jgi:hypothetical protein